MRGYFNHELLTIKGYLMTWEYNQKTGEMRHNGQLVSQAYSGMGEHKNKTASEGVKDNGPIPRGYWRITGHDNSKSPWTLRLHPVAGTQTFGRDGFLIHGDNPRTIGSSSHGCIIINGMNLRKSIFDSGDDILVVK